MELYVNPTITDFRQDVNGDIKMLKIGVDKEDAYANIIGQAEGADLDNNKTKTINVSTYTEPVEVLPTAGKDGMKKATITLSNIPSGGSATAYAWDNNSSSTYFDFDKAPTSLDNHKALSVELGIIRVYNPLDGGFTYTKTSDNEFTITDSRGGTYTYTRNATNDFTLWQINE